MKLKEGFITQEIEREQLKAETTKEAIVDALEQMRCGPLPQAAGPVCPAPAQKEMKRNFKPGSFPCGTLFQLIFYKEQFILRFF